MGIQDIPLSQAAEYFFDQELWQPLCDRHGRERALGFIKGGSGSFFSVGTPDFECGKKIYEQFLEHLKSEEIIATGILPGSRKAERIPGGLWRTLKLDFVSCEAISNTHSFSDIRIRFKKSNETSDLIEQCVTWLKRRREENGDEKKEVLKRAALKEIKGLTVDDFKRAYKIVYGREAGRPPESSR